MPTVVEHKIVNLLFFTPADRGEKGLEVVHRERFDVLVLGLKIPGIASRSCGKSAVLIPDGGDRADEGWDC